MARKRLAVLYDGGSASLVEIAEGLGRLGDLLVVLPPRRHGGAELELSRRLGQVVRLDEVADGPRPDAVLTFSETMLRPAARIAARWGLPAHSGPTVTMLTDKSAQRRGLRRAEAHPVVSVDLTDPGRWPDAVRTTGLPAVVKPARGAASRHTHLVRGRAEGAALVGWLLAPVGAGGAGERRLVVEEYLRGTDRGPFGDYVSVESAVVAGRITHLAVTGKLPVVPPFRETGQFWPSSLAPHEERQVLALTGAALRALGVAHGLTHTEVKLTPRGPRVIEVNGRLGGFVNELSTRAAGVDLVELAGRIALGERPEPAVARPDRVHFQHHTLAPAVDCRIVGVHGASRVRRAAGISGYRTLVSPGTSLTGGVRTGEVDILCGSAEDHARVPRVISEALAELSFTVEFPGPGAPGPVRVGARDLAGAVGVRSAG